MEPFGPIRAAACRLHDKLLAAGADPLHPAEMVEAAALHLELELIPLAPGDTLLKGARALFDEQCGAVCYEMVGSASERALLIAHEIGHAEVHVTSASCRAADIDPSRSVEVAPVGLQRVEDYGARERRELQANVFAREFLLPQPLARRLYLEEHQSASAIAARTGLPVNLIRQQLFDALLLPPVPDPILAPPETALVSLPDPAQDGAAAHRGSAFQLQAGPGTGKTRTLVKRVLSLLAEGVDPAGILVLTFSNRAAGELSERIAAAAPESAPLIWIGTFHAFGLDLIRRYYNRLGLSPAPSLFDRSDAIEVLEEILPTLSLVHYRNLWDPAMELRDIVAAISRAKDEVADAALYRALAQAMFDYADDDHARLAAEKCLEVASVYDIYAQLLRERDAVDFGDLIMRPTLLLEADPALRRTVQLRHRHILVDEYQDVNRASGRLLKAVAGEGKCLWVVGDARQSIYRFRGASSANMTAFSLDYPNAQSDQLAINYRSTSQIVDTLVAVSPRMGASDGMLPLAFTTNRGSGPSRPEIRRFDKPNDEAEGIAASIRELESSGVPLRDQAVLCRTNRRLNEIAAVLEARGIPVLHLGSLFERDEVRDLLALLSFGVEAFGGALTRLGAIPRYGLSLQDVYIVTQRLSDVPARPLAALTELAQTPGLSPGGAAGLIMLAHDLDGLSETSSAWEYLATYLLDRSECVRDMCRDRSIPGRMRAVAVWQFLNFVGDQGPAVSGHPIQRTLDRVRQMVLLAEERDLRQVPAAALHLDAVRLMTVHGSKGLEFEAVHVPGLTVASFPSSNRGQRCPPPAGMIEGIEWVAASEEAKQAHNNEEECLFFVALSRAKTYLRLYLTRFQPNGRKRSASPFLEWIPNDRVVGIDNPPYLSLPLGADRTSVVTVIRPSEIHITDTQLRSYGKCPRRFFYTYVLGLRSARKSTAFSMTHDCLYELIRWINDERSRAEPTLEGAEAAFNTIWQTQGPVSHGYADDYRRLAMSLVATLIRSGAGRRFRAFQSLAVDFPGGRIIVEPDHIIELPNSDIVLQRLRTGHKRSDEYDRLEYTLYHLAGQEHFGAACIVEAHHLTDDVAEMVSITAQKLSNRRTTSNEMLNGVALGEFPTEVDPVACPRCPHFFICGAVPRGTLTLL